MRTFFSAPLQRNSKKQRKLKIKIKTAGINLPFFIYKKNRYIQNKIYTNGENISIKGEIFIAAIFFRTIIIFLFVLISMRIMGKRQIGEMEISELVITLLLSDLATQPITNSNIPLLYGIVPIIILLCLEVIISFLSTKSSIMKKLLSPSPTVLINKGVLDQKALVKMRITLEELLSELRQNGIIDINEVYYAILEENGKISVIPKANCAPLTAKDMNIQNKEKGIIHAIVIDGKIDRSALKSANKSEKWIETVSRENKIYKLKDIMLLAINEQNEITLIKKDR